MSTLQTWAVVVGLMVVCGLAMARMLWAADGKPPLRRVTREADSAQPAEAKQPPEG